MSPLDKAEGKECWNVLVLWPLSASSASFLSCLTLNHLLSQHTLLFLPVYLLFSLLKANLLFAAIPTPATPPLVCLWNPVHSALNKALKCPKIFVTVFNS